MPYRPWSVIVAIGLAVFVLVGLTSVSSAVPEIYEQAQGSIDQPSQPQSDTCPSSQEQTDEPRWWAWKGALVTSSDTLAQWVMVFLSLGALAVSAVAVWLVRDTLTETRKAVADSGRAAKAAEQAVNITRESAQHELRAYLFVSGAKRSGKGIIFTVHNTGSTPAHDASVTFVLVPTTDPTLGMDFHLQYAAIPKPIGVMAPKGTHEFTLPLTGIDGAGMKWYWVLVGHITYRDTFNIWRTTDFKFEGLGIDGPDAGSLAVCKNGNEAT